MNMYQLSRGLTDFFFISIVIMIFLLSSGVTALETLGGDQVGLYSNGINRS